MVYTLHVDNKIECSCIDCSCQCTLCVYSGELFRVEINLKTSMKNIFKKMYKDVGMAVPKTTETRCRDHSVQGRHVIQRLHN